MGVSLDETCSKYDVQQILGAFGCPNDDDALDAAASASSGNSFFSVFERSDTLILNIRICTYNSETDMMRYLTNLPNKDISLTNSMIALGSCTMKLNSALEMEPVSWPEFANVTVCTGTQVTGYKEMIESLNFALAEITQFAAVSTQPNSGASGEYAGLSCIRKYQEAQVESRNICLITLSAHGTNPASAVMAGMKVVTVKSDDLGNIDIDDLRAKAEKLRKLECVDGHIPIYVWCI